MSLLIAGSTGEVGQRLVRNLLAHNLNTPIYAAVRRKASTQPPSGLIPFVVDFNHLLDSKPELNTPSPTVAICCLGTTIKNAGNLEAFRKVDLDYVVNFAIFAKKLGITQFMVISSIGANSDSSNQYLQTKGEMEDRVSELGFEAITFIEPSLLVGNRKEFRLGEKLGGLASGMLSPLLIGPLRKYRPIPRDTVAKAMAQLSTNMKPGIHKIRYNDLVKLAKAEAN